MTISIFVTVVNEYQIIIALLIVGGGLLVASYQEDNREPSSQADISVQRLVTENRRRLKEGTTNKRN